VTVSLDVLVERALAPSITNSIPCSGSRPRSTRSESSAVATVAFSLEPSQTERDLDPVGRDAERDVRPFNSIPSSISTARRTSSSRRPISSPSATRVRSTNARDIDDLLIERAACSSSTPTGSCVRR